MWFVSFLFVFLFLSGCNQQSTEKGKLAQTIYLQPQNFIDKSTFYGTVQALKSSPLVVQTDGTLAWFTKPGDKVLKATAIAKIDNPEIEKVYNLAKDAEDIANQQYKRSLSLSKSKAASQQQLQEREQAWIVAQQNLVKTETDLKKAQFNAPFDGIVGPRLIHDGTHVKAGDVIGHFFNSSDIVVEVQIPVSFKEFLKENQAVIIDGKKYPLPHVPKMLNPATQMIVIHIPIQHSTLLIGEVIDVEIHLKEWEKVIVIPLSAIKFEDDSSSVLVLREGKLEKREVTLGHKDATQAIILKGIQAEESLCLDPHHYYEGESITPQYPEL